MNHGCIKANGINGVDVIGGGGSGGSIFINLVSQNNYFPHHLGKITCLGGNQEEFNQGADGRIAIYGFKSSQDISLVQPKPFFKLQK